MVRPYQQANLVLAAGKQNDAALVRALQRDLRRLGYLRAGIDGDFGGGTAAAVRSLQYDLLLNDGASTARDGRAPVAVSSYNGGRVAAVTGEMDQDLASCLGDLIADDEFPKLPNASDPRAENDGVMGAIAGSASTTAPTPFILAMVKQESGGRHYAVPHGKDEDNYVIVGLDRKPESDNITSRGYGIGQYTLFHHPPQRAEIENFILDPLRNLSRAYEHFRGKFDGYVIGPADSADDRVAEHPTLPLRLCRYEPTDSRYMRDCRACAEAAGKIDVMLGMPVHQGASIAYRPTGYYRSAEYPGVPVRADFLCDWPYAARRYNGSGINSYHYQTRILRNLLALPPWSRP